MVPLYYYDHKLDVIVSNILLDNLKHDPAKFRLSKLIELLNSIDRNLERKMAIDNFKKSYLESNYPNWRELTNEKGCCSLCTRRAWKALKIEALNDDN